MRGHLRCGSLPLQLSPPAGIRNPVLTADDVRDVSASFVADPFLIQKDNHWFLFLEVKNQASRLGEIGLATSADGFRWHYEKTVLREPFHLSYPLVFAWQGGYYMVPEILAREAVVLYWAASFPFEWVPVATLVQNTLADPTPFHFRDKWWMFGCSTPYSHDTLRLYCAPTLQGPWNEHPSSPIITGN